MADEETGEFTIDGRPAKGNVGKFISMAVSIVHNWPEYNKTNLLDSLKYRIDYENKKVKKRKVGVNTMPENYRELEDLIKGATNE